MIDRWAGTYAGVASRPVVKDMVENCECLIKIGVQYTDTTTAGFSQNIDEDVVVDLHYERASIAGRNFAPIALKDALKTLHEVMTSDINIVPKQFCEEVKPHEQHGKDDEAIRQDDLWHIIADALDDKNLVFSEQGTAYFGISDVRLPEGVTSYGQPMWGSIGYTLPASLGAAIASPHKRSILLIGDGSALLTIQEIAVMIQERVNPVIVLINNDGYTVERAIHGENQYYNDIPKCDWQLMPKAFGATDDNSLLLKAETAGELKAALKQAAAAKDKLVMLEVIAGKHDIPPLLADISAALKPKND